MDVTDFWINPIGFLQIKEIPYVDALNTWKPYGNYVTVMTDNRIELFYGADALKLYSSFYKRAIDRVNGGYLKDENGNYVYEIDPNVYKSYPDFDENQLDESILNHLEFQLTKSSSFKDNYRIEYKGAVKADTDGKDLNATIYLHSNALNLAGKNYAAIEMSQISSNAAMRNLQILGEEGSQVVLKNPDFGIELGGLLDFEISGVNNVLISGTELDDDDAYLESPVRAGVILVSNSGWQAEPDGRIM